MTNLVEAPPADQKVDAPIRFALSVTRFIGDGAEMVVLDHAVFGEALSDEDIKAVSELWSKELSRE